MLRDPVASVHTLLRLSNPGALVWDTRCPEWAPAALQRAPWVVMRRAAQRAGLLPVGVRGARRAQRCAAWLPDGVVQRCLTPQLLAAQQVWRRRQGGHANPAIQVLDEVAAVFAAHDQTGRWGPGGSVGFELASALPCTTPDSDLDLVLQADRPIALPDAARLQAELSKLPARIDVLLETPHGAVALSELVRARGVMLLRCPHGPRLVSDPWTADRAAASFS